MLSQALHHSEQPKHALSEAVRILEPGGRLLVIDLLAHNEEWVRDKLQDRQQGFTERKLTALLEGAGLESISVQRVARDPHPPHFMTLTATGTKSVAPGRAPARPRRAAKRRKSTKSRGTTPRR